MAEINIDVGVKSPQEAVKAFEKILSLSEGIRENLTVEKTNAGLRDRISDVKTLSKESERLRANTEKLRATDEALLKENIRARTLLNERKKAIREQVKEEEGLINAYQRESKRLNTLRNNYKNLAVQQKANTKEAKAMLREITKLDTKLKDVDRAVGQNQRSVGDYRQALQGAGRGVGRFALQLGGIASAGLLVAGGITSAVGIIRDFDKANSNLAAVLGTTKDDIKELSDDAKRLGASTAFTASEVAGLQTEFAKLGFTREQILSATEATLNLAAASGTDLANAATVAGSTVRAFGLEAEDTEAVVDIMAKAFSSSSLDIEKFQTSIRAVGPVAKSAGVDLERTTALLGTLTDRGVDASTAGTSLRNVFLELSKRGITFEDAMKKINTATDKNAAALELFGKRGAVTGTILAESGEDIANLEEKLRDAEGAAQDMADTMLDNLAGDTVKAQSAWEGFVLSLDEGGGVISSTLRGITQGVTEMIQEMTRINESETLSGFEQLLALTNPMVGAAAGLALNMEDLAKQINAIGTEKDAQKVLSDIAGQITLLTLEFEKGNIGQEEFTKRLAALREFGKRARLEYGKVRLAMRETADTIAGQEGSLEQNTTLSVNAIKEQIKELKKLRDDVDINSREFDELNTEIARLEALLPRTSKKTKEAETGFALLTKQINDLKKQLEDQVLTGEADATTLAELEALTMQLTQAQRDLNLALGEEPEALKNIRKEREASEKFHIAETKRRTAAAEKQRKQEEREANERADRDRKEAEARRQAKFDDLAFIVDSAGQAANSIADIFSGARERELQSINEEAEAQTQALEDQLEKGLITQEQFEDEKQKLADETAKKQAEIQKQQAIAQKAQTLFNIGIQTALGIISALAQVPKFDFGISATAIAVTIGALGAAQAAAVLATPIPEFAEGTDYLDDPKAKQGKDTILLWGDRGEAIIKAKSNAKYPGLAKAFNDDSVEDWFASSEILKRLSKQKEMEFADRLASSMLLQAEMNDSNLLEALRMGRDLDRKNTKQMIKAISQQRRTDLRSVN